jgi:hypothetical protein
MKILITGSSGLIGSAAVKSLTAAGNAVTRLVRHQPPPGEAAIPWEPAAGRLDPARLEGFDAVVHLAGESIARGRWTAKKMARIRSSRIQGTRLLSETLARLSDKPKVLACASAVGYYGDRGAEEVDETSPPGSGFLAAVCREWEAATQPAADAGIRVVQARLGVVLAAEGGALAKMLPAFRLGLGGRLGSGRQYMSWITLDDVLGAIAHVLATDALRGPVNLVAPQPVTNAEFARALARTLRRPALLPVPAFVLRAALGQMAVELLLSGARVVPRRLLDSGYRFCDPQLHAALRHLLS